MDEWFLEGGLTDSVLYNHNGHTITNYTLSGSARELACGVLWEGVPLGILLDRLTDVPEEVLACPVEVVRRAVNYLRWRHSE